MDVLRLILSRLLPKTGQHNAYMSGDDGYYQAGWWKGMRVYTNRLRFIKLEINHEGVTIDRATGLMWATYMDGAGCNFNTQLTFAGRMAYSASLIFAGYSDWRAPNINELLSIVKYRSWNPSIDTNHFTCMPSNYGTSTTDAKYDDDSWHVQFYNGYSGRTDKDTNRYFRAVRSL